jgi:hypothetical protein
MATLSRPCAVFKLNRAGTKVNDEPVAEQEVDSEESIVRNRSRQAMSKNRYIAALDTQSQ